jgi:polyisoprenoid-binding protein YceI
MSTSTTTDDATQAAASTSPLVTGLWEVDAAHTIVAFSVRHMTIATVTGRFPDVTGQLRVAGDSSATISARIATGTVWAGHPRRDELVRSPEFLDVEQFPELSFTGHIEAWPAAAGGPVDATGELTIKGTTRPLRLTGTFGGVVTHRGATRAGFTADARVDRREFGLAFAGMLDTGGAVVSNEVDLHLEVELVHVEDDS